MPVHGEGDSYAARKDSPSETPQGLPAARLKNKFPMT
jgi:hypothetical protein